MADESDIRAVLTAHTGLTALVANRIYDQITPNNTAQQTLKPFIVTNVVADLPVNSMADIPSIGEFIIQFDIYGATKSQCKAVLTQIRAALHSAGWKGCEESARDLPADDANLRRISSDWRIFLPR